MPANSTVKDVLRLVDLPERLDFIAAVNGQAADEGTPLAEGDTLELIPALEGG